MITYQVSDFYFRYVSSIVTRGFENNTVSQKNINSNASNYLVFPMGGSSGDVSEEPVT